MAFAHEELTGRVIGAMIEVHRALGPGLLESAYEACLCAELSDQGLRFERQKAIPVSYKAAAVDCAYRMDLVVEETIVVELKAIEALSRVHEAQVVTYLRLTGLPVGLLVNFNVMMLKSGLRRLSRDSPMKRDVEGL